MAVTVNKGHLDEAKHDSAGYIDVVDGHLVVKHYNAEELNFEVVALHAPGSWRTAIVES